MFTLIHLQTKKWLYFSLVGIIFGLLAIVCTPLPALALTVTFENQKLELETNDIKLSRPLEIKQFSQFTNQEKSLSQLVNQMAGIPVPSKQSGSTHFSYDPTAVYEWVEDKATTLNRLPQEPVLTIVDNKATEFTPPRSGVTIDTYGSTYAILSALESGLTESAFIVSETKPEHSLADTNNLGINSLVAEGVSSFTGSSKNRRKNIEIGAGKLKGTIVPAGSEFSFNTSLGPIEASEGFVPEIVIKRTGLAPEIGGGICQVSSTVFRGAINAGLPITQRKNHSFAVKYYAPQGTDATIYPGVIDLKFKNDTPGALLIWSEIKDKDTLVFSFYGNSDGREVLVAKPEVFDRKPDGSMKATWKRQVTLNGKTRTDTYKSVYVSPALFKKEETFISPSSPVIIPNASTTPLTSTSIFTH